MNIGCTFDKKLFPHSNLKFIEFRVLIYKNLYSFKMKKITLTTVLLILLTSISGLAQNEKNSLNITEIIVLNFEQDAKVNQDLKINFEVINSTEDNKVSVIVKHETFKSSSRRSRVKNIINFLKNSEKKQGSSIALC